MMKKVGAFSLFFTLFTVLPAIITFAQDIQQGNATWYTDDSLDLYASHARFPPGTRLRVTNLNNQREVYVTVMGRIQNSDNRVLDISQAAAELLDMNERGYTPVRLVVIRGLVPEPTPAPPKTANNANKNETVPDTAPVPEITAVSVFTDDEEDEDDYEGYPDDTPLVQTASAETPSSPPPPIRAFPGQPESQTQPGQTAQPADEHVALKKIVVLLNGKEETIDVPEGVYVTLQAGQARSTTIYPPYTPAPSRVYIQSALPPPNPVIAAPPAIRVIPSLPDPHNGKVYRMQVGAFSQAALAQVCFEKLRSAGLSPAYEQNGSLYRVVLSGINAADVSYTAQRLNAAGFTEAWIREESQR
jgi:rare lipoprotein A